MKRTYCTSLLVLLFLGCNSPDKTQNNEQVDGAIEIQETANANIPTILKDGLTAHGGIDTWNSFNELKYEMIGKNGNKQQHLIDLYTRKVRITDSLFVLGFDGEQVWVSPDLAAYGKGSARFYHNLYFYFFAMPYALADPGINYEDLGLRTINDIEYNAVKVSYNEGVGDSPEDFYIAHFNTQTGLMDLLLYTVTYYSKESHEKYNAILYEWQEVNGMQVTKSIKGYKYDSAKLGDLKYESTYNKVAFSKEKPADTLFSIPDIAEIDSLK